MIECLKVCSQGFSHKANGKPCQDAVFAGMDEHKYYSILAVADGHGGEKYFRSKKGAEFAIKIAKERMIDFLKQFRKINESERRENLIEENAKLIESRIIFKWQEYVKSDFKYEPLSEAEKKLCEELNLKIGTPEETEQDILSLYGSTLLSVLYIPALRIGRSLKSFWIAIQIGDGLTFALDENGKEVYPIPKDESLGFGYTTSLCSSNAAESFRHAYGFSKLNALVVCTDGVADSFEKDKFGDFVKKIYSNINEHGLEAVEKELNDFFPKLSEQGSGDDVSLAGVFEIYKKE